MKLFTGKVHDIDLDEPADERWTDFAIQNGDAIQSLLADVEADVEQQLEPYLPSVITSAIHTLASGSGWLLRQIVNQFGEEYTQELACLARHADVPVGKLMLGNLIYDFTSLAEIYGCGCSSLSFDVDGSPVLVRNMDWVVPRSTGRHTKLIRFHKNRASYTAVGVAGMVGVISAMGENWAVTVNQAPVVHNRNSLFGWLSAPSLLFKWPVLQRVRAVCDRLPSYNRLVLGLRSYDTIVPFFAHVVGSNAHEHTVVTHVGETSTIRTKRSGLAQTNHYISGKYTEYNPENDDESEWLTYSRYDALQDVLRNDLTEERKAQIAQRPVTALQLLKDVTDEDTMQQMVLWPARSQMAVKTRLHG
jgi:hypothetical protein